MENEQTTDYNRPLYNELEKLPVEADLPGPNNPPWNELQAFILWLASIALIFFIPLVGILIFLAAQQVNFTDSKKLGEVVSTDPNAILVNVLCVIPAHLVTILLAWIIVTKGGKHSFQEMLGWKMGGFKVIHLIGIVIGFFLLAALVSYILPEQENDLLRILKSSRAVAISVALMATFTAPLVEEVVYRGVMYSAFQKALKFPLIGRLKGFRLVRLLKFLLETSGLSSIAVFIDKAINDAEYFQVKNAIPLAVLLVTFLFAAVHVPQYYPSYSSILMICLLSLTLTLIRVKSDNLLPCIVLHTIFNGLQSLLIIAQPYLEQTTEAPSNQPAILFWIN